MGGCGVGDAMYGKVAACTLLCHDLAEHVNVLTGAAAFAPGQPPCGADPPDACQLPLRGRSHILRLCGVTSVTSPAVTELSLSMVVLFVGRR